MARYLEDINRFVYEPIEQQESGVGNSRVMSANDVIFAEMKSPTATYLMVWAEAAKYFNANQSLVSADFSFTQLYQRVK